MHRLWFFREKRAGFPSSPEGVHQAVTPPLPSSQILPTIPFNGSSLPFHGAFPLPAHPIYVASHFPPSPLKAGIRLLVLAPNGTTPSIPWNVLPLKGSQTCWEFPPFQPHPGLIPYSFAKILIPSTKSLIPSTNPQENSMEGFQCYKNSHLFPNLMVLEAVSKLGGSRREKFPIP